MAWPLAFTDRLAGDAGGLTFAPNFPSMRSLFNRQPTELQAELTRHNHWHPGQVWLKRNSGRFLIRQETKQDRRQPSDMDEARQCPLTINVGNML